MRSAVTISLVPEARGGPFVFWDDPAAGCRKAAELEFDAVEVFPPSAGGLQAADLKRLIADHRLRLAAVGTGAGWVVHKLRLTDPDAAVRARAREFVAGIIGAAGAVGAAGPIRSQPGRGGGGEGRRTAARPPARAVD